MYSLKPQADLEEEYVGLAKALAHPARLRMVRLLRSMNSCIAGDLAEEVGLAASTVSQHLKQLKEAGWVQGEVDGPRRCYCINPETHARYLELQGELL
ncbi:MAG: ArsR/SmtB family transcription factor [Planctomycetota bacterium]